MTLGKSLELIGKHWNIFGKLSEKQKCYVSELAKELGKWKPQMSKELKELRNNGLVEYEQKEGERLKYYYVSDYAKRILAALTEATQSKPKERLEEWQIDQLLSILEDQELSDDLRLSYSESFLRICREHRTEVASHVSAQKLLEKVMKDPLHDKVTEDLMRSVSAILPHAVHHEKGSRWVLETLYPIIVANMENKNEKIGVRAIEKVGRMASLNIKPSIKAEAEKKFLEIWFSNETKPESDLGKAVKQQLVELASKHLFEKVRAKAKNQEDRAKAEILLEGLKEYLLPKSSAVNKRRTYRPDAPKEP